MELIIFILLLTLIFWCLAIYLSIRNKQLIRFTTLNIIVFLLILWLLNWFGLFDFESDYKGLLNVGSNLLIIVGQSIYLLTWVAFHRNKLIKTRCIAIGLIVFLLLISMILRLTYFQ